MWAIFEKFSQATDKGKLKPINVKLSPNMAFDKLVEHYKSKDFLQTKFDREFFDIFLNQYGYEISIVIGQDTDASATIGVTVYHEKIRGGTRKLLKYYLEDIQETLKDYIL